MKCAICKDKGYIVIKTSAYRRVACRCGQKGGGQANRVGDEERRAGKA